GDVVAIDVARLAHRLVRHGVATCSNAELELGGRGGGQAQARRDDIGAIDGDEEAASIGNDTAVGVLHGAGVVLGQLARRDGGGRTTIALPHHGPHRYGDPGTASVDVLHGSGAGTHEALHALRGGRDLRVTLTSAGERHVHLGRGPIDNLLDVVRHVGRVGQERVRTALDRLIRHRVTPRYLVMA